MDRRQFLSLSAMTCLGAARGTSAATGFNTRDVRDFDIAFITDVHIERDKVATAKFGKTVAEINTLKPAFVWDMGDMSLYPNSGKFVSSISVCGCWWRSGEGFERGVDNVPRGYRIIEIREGRISHRYVSSCESRVDRQGEFMGLEDSIKASKSTPIIVNCYDAPNNSTAKARIDSDPWTPMQQYTEKGGYSKM